MPLERAIGKAIIQGLARERLSAGRMISILRQSQATYRRQEMLDDIRAATQRVKYEGSIRRLQAGATVPRGWMVETELADPKALYRVFGEATYYDEATDTYEPKTVSFYHNELKDNLSYGDDFIEYQPTTQTDPDRRVVEFKQTGLEHNVNQPY